MSESHLEAWEEKVSALAQRILSVYEPPEFNTLRQLSDQPDANAAGESGADPSLRLAVSAICDALVLNLRLVEKIKEAKELRAKPKPFQNHWDAEVATILTQPVIPVNPAELQNPGLFKLTSHKYKLGEIYDLLDMQVGQAAAILTEATRKLRDTQDLLAATQDEMKRGRQDLSRAGIADPQIDGLQNQLNACCARLAQDPLSEPLRTEVQSRIANFKTVIEARVEAVNRVGQLQNAATRLSADLQEKHRQAQQSFADRLARVQVHSGAYPPLPEATINDLAGRLAGLLAPSEDYQGVTSQLTDWLADANSAIQKSEESRQKNKDYLDLRLELRGLLTALAAKAVALNKAEDRQISALLDQAHTKLYQRPTPIELARELLSQVERALNQVHPTG
jgi:chromosome segregation ATPase